MSRLSQLTVAALLVGMIAVAPRADAQIPDPVPPPTPEDVRAEREVIEQRAARLDRGLVTAEEAVERIRDPEVRADVRQRLQEIRERRTAWGEDWMAFQQVAPEQFHDRREAVDEHLVELERDVLEARLHAAVTPVEFRRVVQEHLGLHRRAIDRHHQRIAELPRERRAQAAYELIRLRTRFDELHRQAVMMQHLPAQRFATLRPEFTATLPGFHAEVQRVDLEWRVRPEAVTGPRAN